MERLSVQQKTPKQTKGKKKPIKVVYISNPMKVKTSASEFRSLVQELTGKYSDVADNIGKYPESGESGSMASPIETGPKPVYESAASQVDSCGHVDRSPFDMMGEAFGSHEMLEDIPGLLGPPHYYRSFSGV